MINAFLGITIFLLLFFGIMGGTKILDVARSKGHKSLHVDYGKIADLELEIYGHTFNGDVPDDSPRAQRQKEERNKEVALWEQAERLASAQGAWNPIPHRDPSPMPTYPGDPNWTDEDGRPW